MTNRLITLLLLVFSPVFIKAQCTESIVVSPSNINCLTWNFELGTGSNSGASVAWDFGFGIVVSAGNSIQHTFSQTGFYNICASYINPLCQDSVVACITLAVECPECPLEIEVNQLTDEYVVLTATDFPDNALIHWENNGQLINTGNVTTVLLQSGVNNVCAYYETPECPQGVFWCQNFFQNILNCPDSLIVWQSPTLCNTYLFSLNNYGNAGNLVWNWGDGTTSGGTNNVWHTFEEPGEYEVCAQAWSSGCPQGVEICTTVEVEECEIICPEQIVASNISCGLWVFAIMPGNSVLGANWTFGNTTLQFNGNTASYNFTESGTYTITVNASLGQPCFNNFFTVTIDVEVCTGNSCPDELIITPANLCGAYNFTVNHPGSVNSIIWYYGNGFVGGGNQINAYHNYQNPGTYEVCAVITADSCSTPYEICQTLVVPECPDCPTAVMYEQISCNTYVFWLDNAIPDALVQWNFNGVFVSADGSPQTVTLNSGLNVVYALYYAANAPQCSQSTYVTTLEVDDCEEECPTSLNIQEMTCGYYYFMGWNNPGEEIVWSYNDGTNDFEYTTITNGFISHMFTTPGEYVITGVYYSDNCPDGVTLTQTIVVPDCQLDNCTVTLSYTYLGDGVFSFTASGEPNGMGYWWDFGNGNATNGPSVMLQQFEPGVYTVCASYASSICFFPEIVACVTIEVPEIEVCQGYLLSFESELSNTGFSVVTFSLTDSDGNVFQGGTFFVSDVFGYFEGEVCLPDGCYTLDLDASNSLGLNINDLNLLIDGTPFEGFVNIVQVSNTQVQVQIDVNGDCDFSTGIADSILDDIQVYPVPATDVLNIVIPAGERVEAAIYSITGQIIYRAQLNQTTQLNTQNWAPGLYLLQLENNYSTKTQKIQKF